MRISFYSLIILFLLQGCNPDGPAVDKLQLVSVRIGQTALSTSQTVMVESGNSIVINFNKAIAIETTDDIQLTSVSEETDIALTISSADLNKQLLLETGEMLKEGELYLLDIPNTIKGEDGALFDGISYNFEIETQDLELVSLSVGDTEMDQAGLNKDLPLAPVFKVIFNQDVPLDVLAVNVYLNGDNSYQLSIQKL